MCIEILYIFCCLYGTYCISFCSALGYTIWKEEKERKYIQIQQENAISTVEISPRNNINTLETIYESKELGLDSQSHMDV